MTSPTYENLDHDITRIDTGMGREELAACYLLKGGEEYAIIETGTHRTVPIVLELLAQRGIERSSVKFVIPTHVHLDHAGGVGGLMQELPEATLLIHPRGARHMIDPAKLKAGVIAVYGQTTFEEVYGDILPVDAERVRTMEDGDSVDVGGRELVFYDTPGHARHHFCVHDPESRGVFTGDTFGLAYPPLTTDRGPFIMPTSTPVQFDPPALKDSIRKLVDLGASRMYLTHYGVVEDPATLGERLVGMVDDYVALTEEATSGVSVDAWTPAIESGMRDYLYASLRKHGCELPESRLDELLAMDIDLNAQGLSVWMRSRSKA